MKLDSLDLNALNPKTMNHLNPRTEKEQGWIGWVFFSDLFAGLALTVKYLFSKPVTMQYPDKEKWRPYARFRGHHFLLKDEHGQIKCVACELCARICPSACIKVIPFEDEHGERRPAVFDIDMGRCLYCGLCEDACPVEAIAMGSHYEFSSYSARDLLVHKQQLLTMPGKTPTGGAEGAGGTVVAASLSDDGTAAEASKQEQGYHWWDIIHRRDQPKSDRVP